MRRAALHKSLVILLVLTRLVAADLMHLSAAQATAHEPGQPMMMMGAEPCSGMTGSSTDHAKPSVPTHDGSCCKSSQCPCLHAAALLVALQMPVMFGISYAEVPAAEVYRISGPPSVFFRPPIQARR